MTDLLQPGSSEWNLQAIREHLPQYEDAIKAIIPSDGDMNDELVWLKDTTGSYTTKSGYAVAKLNTEAEPSDHFD